MEKKFRLLLLLVLLMTAATGAWAQTETLLTTITPTAKEQASYSTANVATVSFSYTAGGSSAYLANWGWWGYGWIATVTAAEGYTITKCIFYDDADRTATDSEAPFVVETTDEDKTPRINETPIDGGNQWSKGIKKIEVYGYVTPTYSVTLAEGTEDADNWTVKVGEGEAQAFPVEGLEGGEKITVTYSGEKKVKSVKAVKKAPAYTLLSAATTSDQGKVVCAAGHLHDAKTAVPDGCTAVGILGKVTETGHGLILAMQNATEQTWTTINGWTSVTTYAGTTLKVLPDAARGTNLTSYTTLGATAVSNWAVAQKSDYEAIFTNLGSTKNSDGMTYDNNVNAYITTGVGGTAISGNYWSATELDGDDAWDFSSRWDYYDKSSSSSIRPVLGF